MAVASRMNSAPAASGDFPESAAGTIPSRPMPVSTFRWALMRLPRAHGGGRIGAGGAEGGDRLPQVEIDQAAGVGRRRVAEHQDRYVEAVFPQVDPFCQAGHPQPLGAVRQRGAGHLNRAVAVPVGFDHGHHPGLGAGETAQLAHVVGDGAQIDFGPDQGGIVHRVSCVHRVTRVHRVDALLAFIALG